jgi:alpha-L-rhamnosidase
MKKAILFAFALILVHSCTRNSSPSLTPVSLRCNNLENPSGTGNDPVFNWIIQSSANGVEQTAYQIILDSDPRNLRQEKDCLLNTGKITSSRTSWISLADAELEPSAKYYWKVRFWDSNDNPSGWSETAFFITGLFDANDWEGARWIGYEDIADSLLLVPGVHGNGDNLGEVAGKRTIIPYFRREFVTEKEISEAFIYVSGLGHYELYLNGDRIGNRFLSPGWTNYDKTCFYNTFDVTEELKRGKNLIGAIVGNGFYNINRERYRKLVIAYGAPKVIIKLAIKYTDGSAESIISDETWKSSPSPVTFTSIYGGEDYDATIEQEGWNLSDFDDAGWKPALVVKAPDGSLQPELDYPLQVMQVFEPAKLIRKNDSLFVYDYEQNASGIIRLKVTGRKGQTIRIIPGELIDDDSLVNQRASGSPYYFSYTLKGDKEETWIPKFTYYGFRYAQIEGAVPSGRANPGNLPEISGLEMLHTRNSSPAAGSFRCSNELFNSVYELINWSVKSNLASVATDCPHREKLGWLEQTHLMGNSIKYLYDIRNLYTKAIDDMIEAQLDNGLVPDIAPEYVPFNGGFRDSPEWSSACVILPWDMYEWYGDLNAIKKAYPMMKRYLGYLEKMAADNILSHGLGDWYDLGPGFPGEAQLTPKAVTATSIYFYDAKLLSEMAELIGKKEDAVYYRDLSEKIRRAFNDRFFDPATNVYSTGSQTAYSMPLFFGMVDDSVKNDVVGNLLQSINENKKSLTAGDVGYRYLLRVLENEGHSQLIFEMNSRTDVPGYGYQLSKGATSLTESWAGLRDVSNNHMMLGHLMEWFFSGLGGIRQMPGSIAYENILIAPELAGDITWAETSYQSVNGMISSSWKIEDKVFTLQVRIPSNCRATVKIPRADPERITVNDIPVRSSESAKLKESLKGSTFVEVGPGEYSFECRL